MQRLTTRLALVLVLCLGLSQAARADRDRDRDRNSGASSGAPVAYAHNSTAPEPGSCALGRAERDLDVNNVLARAFTTGSLFYGNSSEAAYLVPRTSGLSPIYATGIWIGGTVDGELRVAGATYSNYEFWPGPLDDATGRPVNPNNCTAYDRIWKVGRQDILDYEGTGQASSDLAEWPAAIGAPVIAAPGNGIDDDGDGLVDEGTDGLDNDEDGFIDERDEQERRIDGGYDLAAGDRPEIVGDQALWWVMNDVGNVHANTGTPPLGVEVQVLAWSFARADALGETTFYRYRVINKSGDPIEDTYLTIFSDPDLGDAADDYVGIDTSLSLGYVYNADNADGGANGYGAAPPAAGYDFFQGPIVDGDTLGATNFMYFVNGATDPQADPAGGQEYYNVMQGRWTDGTPMTEGGAGYPPNGPNTTFAFPGNPVTNAFWSEVNNGTGANTPGDRRLTISTGPFTLAPNDPQDIVFGLVYARGSSNLNSIDALRNADRLAQTAYDIDFELATPAPPPPACDATSSNPQLQPGSGSCAEAVELNGQAALVWGYPTNSPNYLGQYEVQDRLLAGGEADDDTYNFEGFNIYRYPTSAFDVDERELVATYDIVNGITTIIDQRFDPELGQTVPFVAARGTDSGIQYYYVLPPGLTNYRDYYYGITTYIQNAESTPTVIESSPTVITVRPADVAATNGGTVVNGDIGTVIEGTPVGTLIGSGSFSATVVDPTRITGDEYRVVFFTSDDGEGHTATNYRIVNATTGEVVFDGEAYFQQTGQGAPTGSNVVVADGLSFTVQSAPGAPLLLNPDGNPESLTNLAFVEVLGPGGTDACPPGDTSLGCPQVDGDLIYQSFNSNSWWVGYHGGAVGPEGSIGPFAPNEFEIRFTTEGSLAYHAFSTGRISRVPFEVWDVGVIVPGQPNDPSDDVQMIAAINSVAGTDQASECTFDFGDGPTIFGLGTTTDWIYSYYPTTTYADWAAAAEATNPDSCPISPATDAASELIDFGPGRPLQRFLMEDATGGAISVTDLAGSVLRFYTSNPLSPGDQLSLSTAGLEAEGNNAAAAAEAIERIGVVPNPYLGASAYETGNLDRVARFINMPQTATIRIFTVSGTLIRTIRKDGPSRSVDWDLTTENNLPVASGMYLIHVEVPGVGERVIKFGVINRQTQVDVF